MIDCGEGTQMQASRYRIKLGRLRYIFISHLHGDHFLGLMGLISTMHLRQRKDDLTIFGPRGLSELITLHLKHTEMVLSYSIHFKVLTPNTSELLLDHEKISVHSFPLDHRIPCWGFVFKEKPKPYRINKDVDLSSLSKSDIQILRSGHDVLNEQGEVLHKLGDYTLSPKNSVSYAYCSDTKYSEDVLPHIEEVDVLYHEATFTHDQIARATTTYHSTARQAAQIAHKGRVKKLILGHFSIRYKNVLPLLDEAQEVFQHTQLAVEGERMEIKP